MNIEQLQLVNRNETSTMLLKLFTTMHQISDETNLVSFYNFLIKKGNNIIKSQYDSFFKELEEMDIGYLSPNGIFKWNFNIKDVSEQILFPNKMIKIRSLNQPEEKEVEDMAQVKRSPGRPKGSRNKGNEPTPTRTVERPSLAPTMPPEKEVIFLFTTNKGKHIPFNLSDAERLIQQLQEIKQQMG
jgi:hypothetical protein